MEKTQRESINILSSKLKNIGPALAEKLIKAGIDTPDKLRKTGAKTAFLLIDETGGFCGKHNALYLYALEGAIRDCDWLAIPERIKQEYKDFTRQLRQST